MSDTWQMAFDGDSGPASDEDERLRLSDLGKLARRSRRRVVRAARADDRPTFVRLLTAHLGDTESLDVVEESWPAYDHGNVQVGLDVWLAGPGRSHELVGMTHFRHTEFGLTDLLRPQDTDEYGPFPGNVSRTNLPCGPGGQVRQAVRAGVYLVRDGDSRAAILVVAGDPRKAGPGCRCTSWRTAPARRTRSRPPCARSPSSTTCSVVR